jgi:hypothetical protein
MYSSVFMSTVIDPLDSDVTILAQRLHDCVKCQPIKKRNVGSIIY